MRRHIKYLLPALLLFAACGPKAEPVKMLRFEQFLFAEGGNHGSAADFASPLLNYYPDDPAFMGALTEFTNDKTVRDIYRITDSLYHNLDEEAESLGRALQKAYSLWPEMPRCERVFTMVTADYNDYDMRTFTHDGTELCIALDYYALGSMGRFGHFGFPNHILRLCTREQMVPDCMRCLADNAIDRPTRGTLLDYAIADGKVIYFVEQTMPKLADTTLMQYTKPQLEWMKENVGPVWAWMIENELLYSTDLTHVRSLLGDAPKTNAFGEGSAPRTAAYIGWQIVRQYMKKTGSTMSQLMAERDSQRILNQSGWRP